MSGWNLAQVDSAEVDHDVIDNEPVLPPPPKFEPIETKLVDLAGEAEAPKKYTEKAYEKPKSALATSEPLNVYEPGFRSDLYAGITKYFREKRDERRRLDDIRKKLGLRG